MNCLLRTKTIEEEEKVVHKEIEHKNPYIRLYGSKVKSHFSQSHCEFFEESDEDKKNQNESAKPCNNVDSLDHINNVSSLTGNNLNLPASSAQNQPNLVHNSASIYSGDMDNSGAMGHGNIEEKSIQRQNSLDLEIEEMDNEAQDLEVNMEHDSEDDKKSALIIHSRRSSMSTDSIGSHFDNLKENSSLPVQKFFEGSKSGDGVFFAQRQQIEEKLQTDENGIEGTGQESDTNYKANQAIESEEEDICITVTGTGKEGQLVQTEEAEGDCKGKQCNDVENDSKKDPVSG